MDADVGKQAGRIERLQSLIEFGGAEPAARARLEIGADGRRLDAPAAFHDDRIGGLRNRNARHCKRQRTAADRTATENRA